MTALRRSRRPLLSRDEMIGKVRQVRQLLDQGLTMKQACDKVDIGDASYYRWRQKYFAANKPILVDDAYEIAQLKKQIAELETKIVSLKKKNKKLKRKS